MKLDDKPDLSDDLLVHFGIKGMKWGVRNQKSSNGDGRNFFQRHKKGVAIGAGVAIAGAATAAVLLSRRGSTPINKIVYIPKASTQPQFHMRFAPPDPSPGQMMRQLNQHKMFHFEQRAALAGRQAVFGSDGTWRLGGPNQPARAIRDAFANPRSGVPSVQSRLGQLTRSAQADSARIRQTSANVDRLTQDILKRNQLSLDEVRRNLVNPNHVWQL